MSLNQIEIKSDYVPGTSAKLFHGSAAKYKVVVGGYGCGKSRMVVEELITLMVEYPGIEIMVCRKTMPSLRMTTLNEFLKFVPPELGNYNKVHDNFHCVNGSKMMFRGLDEPDKFKSLNISVIVFEEGDEFELADFTQMNARIRQMNPDKTKKAYPLHFIILLNPCDEEHWIYKTFVDQKPVYEAQGGILELHIATDENIHNLPPGYIEQFTAGMSVEAIQRYRYGGWGTIIKGEPVYGKLIRGDMHIRKVKYIPGFSIMRGWDFGFNHPACVIRIKDFLGRKNIFYEKLGEKEYLDVFARRVLVDFKNMFGSNPLNVFDYCDPRGNDKSDKGQSSVEMLTDVLGSAPVFDRGVKEYVEPGIKIVRKELSTLIEGEPELSISPDCKIIRSAYTSKYVRDDDGLPKKDGYYDHVCDADRYIAYNDKSNSLVKDLILQRKQQYRPRNSITGY